MLKHIVLIFLINHINEQTCEVSEGKTSIILRKILQENSTKTDDNVKKVGDVKNTYWSEMLAAVIVDKIKEISFEKGKEKANFKMPDENSYLTTIVSESLQLFKLFYDRYYSDRQFKYRKVRTIEKYDPDMEFEVIDPSLCNNGICGDVEIIKHTMETKEPCPEGMSRGVDGKCVAESEKFILGIPSQCPSGYRRDYYGICRKVIWW